MTRIRDLLPLRHQVPIKYWYCRATHALEVEMVCLKLIVRSNDRVVDVGGNRGIYAYALVRRRAAVEVFEPNPTCCRLLEAWAAGNRQINVHAVALSDCAGTGILSIPVDGAGVEHDASASLELVHGRNVREHQVPLRTLDSYRFGHVSLIKIDVEGHELRVIAGAVNTLRQCRPALLIEIEERHTAQPIGEVLEQVGNYGYKGFFIEWGAWTPIERFDPVLHQSLVDLGDPSKRYVNNFLFLHQDRVDAGDYRGIVNSELVK